MMTFRPLMTQSGHERVAFAAMHAPDLLYSHDPSVWDQRAMKRREFITLLGSAVAVWPLAAHAQQPGMLVIGWLDATAAVESTYRPTAFRQGLNEVWIRRRPQRSDRYPEFSESLKKYPPIQLGTPDPYSPPR